MKHFLRIGDIDALPLVHALRVKDLWASGSVELVRRGDIDVVTWAELPQLRAPLFDLLHRVEAVALSEATVHLCAPSASLGFPALGFDHQRYVIALQSYPGALIDIAGEQVITSPGECWWLDSDEDGRLLNNSADDWIGLMVEAKLA